MGLIEMLRKRAELVAKMRKMVDEAKEKAMTADEEKTFDLEYNKLKAEIVTLDKSIDREKELEKLENDSALSQAETRGVNPALLAGNPIQGEKLDDGGFKNTGELLFCLKNGDKQGRIQKLATSDLGVLLPPQFGQNMLKLDAGEEIVAPRAQTIPAGDPPDAPFVTPYFVQGSNGALGGISMTWTAEAKTVQDVGTPKVGDMTLTPQECSGLATINNKTLANWAASGAWMQNLMRMAWTSTRDYKFIFGSGVGCPHGFIKGTGIIKIARNTTSTIKYIDTLNMLAVLYAGPGEPVYIANQTLMPTIMTMTDPAGQYIFNSGDATKGIPPTLNGIRIMWNGKTALLGAEGDLILAKLNYYVIKEGSGPFIAISDQFKFDTNQTVFRIVVNIDGQLWVKNPLKLEDNTTKVSPVVMLKA